MNEYYPEQQDLDRFNERWLQKDSEQQPNKEDAKMKYEPRHADPVEAVKYTGDNLCEVIDLVGPERCSLEIVGDVNVYADRRGMLFDKYVFELIVETDLEGYREEIPVGNWVVVRWDGDEKIIEILDDHNFNAAYKPQKER